VKASQRVGPELAGGMNGLKAENYCGRNTPKIRSGHPESGVEEIPKPAARRTLDRV
jgi:hypothetical protein